MMHDDMIWYGINMYYLHELSVIVILYEILDYGRWPSTWLGHPA